MPGSAVDVTLFSTPVALGTLVSDASGNVTGSFAVPSGTVLGAHVIQLDGTGLSGFAQSLSANITVVSQTTVPTALPPPATGRLPTTGSDDIRLIGIAMLFLGAGVSLLIVRRRLANS